jgi:hypothetical protein
MKNSIRDAVARSAPDHTRPRLRESLERRFAPLEQRAACYYADAEATCELAQQLAADLERESGVVSGELEITESLTHAAEAVVRAARPSTEGA